MNSQTVKFILLACLIFQSGCDITFKRKNNNHQMTSVEMSQNNEHVDEEDNATEEGMSVFDRDNNTIISFYADPANAIIRKDMRKHAKVTKNQEKKLVVGKTIPRNIQVVPLPMQLERILSPLPLQLIRVQACMQVMVMDVKSRKILTVIRIK